MSAFHTLATHLVAEVPIASLQDRLGELTNDIPMASGGFCGGGCRPFDGPINGVFCGFSCRPTLIAGAQGVVDQDGSLGFTAEDLASVRKDLPKLRQAIIYQIEANLAALR